jgi:hypothetical protein
MIQKQAIIAFINLSPRNVMPYQKHKLHDSPDIRGRLPYCAPGPTVHLAHAPSFCLSLSYSFNIGFSLCLPSFTFYMLFVVSD